MEEPVDEPIILHEVDERQGKSSDSVLQALLETQKSMAVMMEQMRMELGDLRLVVRTKDEEIHRLQGSMNASTQQQVATTVEIVDVSRSDFDRYAKTMDKSMEMEFHIDAYNNGNGREAAMYPVAPVVVSRVTGILLATVYEEAKGSDTQRASVVNSEITKKIQPTLISGRKDSKKEYFPIESQPYFTGSGDYPDEWPTFVVNYMNRFV